MAVCGICPRGCVLSEGETGWCGARSCRDGRVVCDSYGLVTAVALDPIEKKPLARFRPGTFVLSVGSYGCNLACPWCQNSDISMVRGREASAAVRGRLDPEELVSLARRYVPDGNIGVAFTYNEPFVGFEYLRDAMPLVRKAGLANVVVTNGYINPGPLEELAPHIDALNIDLKGFDQAVYDAAGAPGGLEAVKRTIARCARDCHVEVTTLVIPGFNDDPALMEDEADWLASVDRGIPLHLTRFFPRHRMLDRSPTPLSVLRALEDVASPRLDTVLLGNV